MQQATCAHSGAGAPASPGNVDSISAPSRRDLFGIAVAGGALALTAATLASSPVSWDAAMKAWQAAKSASEAAWKRSKRGDLNAPSSAEIDRLTETEAEAWTALMNWPAPNVRALCWKVEQALLVDDDGYTASWRADVVAQLRRDARRVALNG